jgi:hypothetical protein
MPGLLVESDRMLAAVGEAADDDARQAVLALEPNEVVCEGHQIEKQPARLVRQDLAPVLDARIGHRSLADAEVLRAGGVRHDEKAIAVVVHGILVAVLAPSHQPHRPVGPVGLDQVDFVGLVVVGVDRNEPAGLGLADADIEADVLLLVDERVLFGRRAEPVPVHEQGPVVVVQPHVEQGAGVARPDYGAARVGNCVGEVLPGLHVPEANREELRALVVDRIGQVAVVGAVRCGAELPVGLALRFPVAVHDHLLGPTTPRAAAQPWVLSTCHVAYEVFERPIGRGNRAVVLLDARLHFREQRVLQLLRVLERGLGVGVFRLQVGADVRIEQPGIAHHLLPVGRAQPTVLVHQLDTVPDGELGAPFGDRGEVARKRVVQTVHLQSSSRADAGCALDGVGSREVRHAVEFQ